MPLDYEQVLGVVTRLVSARALDMLPKKRGDQAVLLALASAGFEPSRVYRVNAAKLDQQISVSARSINPGAVLVSVRLQREERKRARAN